METETQGNNYPQPLPDLLEGEEVYMVEQILKHQRRGRGYQYYVLVIYHIYIKCYLRFIPTILILVSRLSPLFLIPILFL